MEDNSIKTYKDLFVWQKSIELVLEIYRIADHFPKEEVYGITSQMKRSAVSIPSNIAEGKRRGTRRDFCYFLNIAYGSGAELETQIEIVKKLNFGINLDFAKIDLLLNEIMRMLNVMISKLKIN